MRATVFIKKNEEKRILDGHPWIFSNEIEKIEGLNQDGDITDIYDYRNKFIGVGYCNTQSLISVRVLSRKEEKIDREFLKTRLLKAIDYRNNLFTPRDGWRIVFSESDRLPGLIADKYGDFIVLQFLTLGMERLSEDIIENIIDIFNPKGIILKNDSPFRKLEGLKQEKKILGGNLQEKDLEVIIEEQGLKFKVDILNGQKTGFFLDQRDNRDYFSHLNLTGSGLDCFCYTGAWGMRMADKFDVTCIDSSETAISIANINASLNSRNNINLKKADVFEYLDNSLSRGEKFEWISLDPPAFVKSKKKLKEAMTGYKSLNTKAMKLIKSGGILITSSCSGNLREDVFIKILKDSAKEAKKDIRIIFTGCQAKDHPVIPSMPESKYLKCIFLQIF